MGTMRLCLIFCVLLTSGCAERVRTVYQSPYVPADLLTTCDTPLIIATTEGELMEKALRIARDRNCANAKIMATAEILTGVPMVGPQ